MHSMNTQVDTSTFSGFNNFFFNLFAYFIHHLFDTCRVNTPIGNQLVQSKACNFAAYRVESRKHNGFGGIVNNYFNTSCRFECTNVTTFATYNTAFNFIVFDVKNSNSIFYSGFGSNTLNRFDNYFFGFFIGI